MTDFLLNVIDGVILTAVILNLKEKKNVNIFVKIQKSQHLWNKNNCFFLFIVKTLYLYEHEKQDSQTAIKTSV